MKNVEGLVFVICAPSGTGKTTLAKRLLDEFTNLKYSVSCTTRAPRMGEEDGVDYFFISKDDFRKRRENNEFIEWAEVHGNFYGTLRKTMEETLRHGNNLLFDIDVQGSAQIRLNLPGKCKFAFIAPPSMQALKQRLTNRGSDNEETIKIRLQNARNEVANAHWFDYIIVNDELEEAYAHLHGAYLAAQLSPIQQAYLINSLLIEPQTGE